MQRLLPANPTAHHGIVNNLRFQPEREKPDWFWQRKYIHGTTLFDEARKAGLTTAALLWPVASRSGITYNLPEVWANRPWQNQLMMSFSTVRRAMNWIYSAATAR